tara:strand:+ start:5605 stop:5811 length:207 start_codon:yes stop_codon:yes gene_type:complete
MKYQIKSQTTAKNVEIYKRTKDYVHSFKSMLDKQDIINDLLVTEEEHELSDMFIQDILDEINSKNGVA